MTKNRRSLGSNLVKVDAHIIQPHEYDELPEWTDEMFDQATIKMGNETIRRGRPKLDNPKKPVTLRIDSAVEEAYRATGSGWQTLMNAALAEYARMHGML